MAKEPKTHDERRDDTRPDLIEGTKTAEPQTTELPLPDQPADQETMIKALDFPSINEPPSRDAAPPEPPPPLVLTSIEPASIVVSAELDFGITVTGSGFDAASVIVFDDEELATTFVSETELTARPAMAAAPAIVDVEVSRGEELSDVLTFEFTAVAGRITKPERKAKKDTPHGKRAKKGKR